MLHIESRRVTQIKSDTGGMPFQQYAENFLRARLPVIVAHQLTARFKLSEADAAKAAPVVTDALIANYAGDEAPPPQTLALINEWVNGPEPHRTLGLLLHGIWTDLPPADTECVLPLNTK